MKLKEVFIYNETYQLTIKENGIFDSRVIKCSKNPMCLNNVKYDAETFISSFAKKVGTKIENGEESSFFVDNSNIQRVFTKTNNPEAISPIKVILIFVALFLAYKAITSKNVYMGIATIVIALIIANSGNMKTTSIF